MEWNYEGSDYIFSSYLYEDMLYCTVLCLVTQSCPTLHDPMDCSPPGSSVHGDSPGKNTGVGCRALLQGIFPTQGLNSGLQHCGQILYHLSHQGSPCYVSYSTNIAPPYGRCWINNSFYHLQRCIKTVIIIRKGSQSELIDSILRLSINQSLCWMP